jgi:hypothetical protein
MATEKQIAADQKNAQNSTGPKTEKGKARTRLNAKRDGHNGQVTTPSGEDRPLFEALKAELIADLAPKTVMELKLASSIAWDTWRLDHLRAMQAEWKHAYEKERAQEVFIVRHNDLNGLPYQVPAAPTHNGFVFSNEEIFAAANRESTVEIAKVTVNQLPY